MSNFVAKCLEVFSPRWPNRTKGEEPPLPAPLRLVLQVHPTAAMYVCTRQRIADELQAAGGSMELTELLGKTNIRSADHLYRLLRSCESEGIFSVKQDGETMVVHNTPESCMLIRDAPGSLAPMVLHAMYESALALNHLNEVVTSTDKSKSTAWDYFSPKTPYWAWLDEPAQKETRQNFNSLMVHVTEAQLPFICKGFAWGSLLEKIGDGEAVKVVDVGGGKGHLLRALLEVASFEPIVFDTPLMVDEAAAFWGGTDVELVKGDFFKPETIPLAHVYTLKHILHDWSDEKAIEILRAVGVQASKVANSRVMIIELVLDADRKLGSFEAWLDIQMLNLVGGKERSRKQWERDVISKAGMRIEGVHVTGGDEAIIECSIV
mmetsp:Transcript_11580/g.32498  ORF Transcript_11580/g.32498 Transcript_11580/m.32498 type:complete len:378 (+) Transcript_11580:5633-6766(+)